MNNRVAMQLNARVLLLAVAVMTAVAGTIVIGIRSAKAGPQFEPTALLPSSTVLPTSIRDHESKASRS